MKMIRFILIITILTSCTNKSTDFENLNLDNVVEHFDNGYVKSAGDYNSKFLPQYNGKIGLWYEFYQNGKLKEVGNYKSDFYTQCCTAGPCKRIYDYKIGDWEYYYDNGNIKAKGTYELRKKQIHTSCEGGDTIYFGNVTNNWRFYNIDGLQIDNTIELMDKVQKDNEFYESGMIID